MRCYVVGGAVRDMLLGRRPKEHDVVFFGEDEELLRVYPKAKAVGQFHEIFLVGDTEFSRARGADIHEDLAARDLTINALALDEDGRLFAHPQALEDLRRGLLRPASAEALDQDPVRVFRAARFAAELPDFQAAPELLADMERLARTEVANGLAAERVAGELLKALGAPRPSRFIELLHRTNNLAPWFAELVPTAKLPAGPPSYHSGSILDHLMETMNRAAGDPLTVWMAMVHDLGKTETPSDLLPHHYGHEERGVRLAQALAERLRLSGRHLTAARLACRFHMKAARYFELRPAAKVDMLMPLHTADLLERLARLCQADRGPERDAEGLDALPQAMRQDLDRILAIRLPPEQRNLGEESGRRLRELRCQALASPAI